MRLGAKKHRFGQKKPFLLSKTSVFLQFVHFFCKNSRPKGLISHLKKAGAFFRIKNPAFAHPNFPLADIVLLFQIYIRLQPLAIG
jgi:hypothetical protein